MTSSLDERIINVDSDDEYTIEYYDYEMADENKDNDGQQQQQQQHNKRSNSVSVETVEDDDDEYTYEEEIIEVVMKDDEEDIDSTAAPPPLPMYRATDPGSTAPVTTPNTSTLPQAFLVTAPPSPTRPPPVATSYYGVKDAPVLLTPSKQRAKAAGSAGLSELSKQLRILQAKNESQAVDINRLERQLRILADLQGISVSDLRKALEDACASEAFGELQHRVSKLKYELEAANLAKQAELRKDATAPHIANLELRVGELEEVEEKQMVEIRNLYEELRQERAKSTRFESENQQLKKALQDMIQRLQSETARAAQLEANFQKQIQQFQERQSKKMQEEAERSCRMLNSVGNSARAGAGNLSSMISPEMAAEYEQMVQLLKEKDAQLRGTQAKLHADDIRRAEKLKDSEERARKVQMDMKVEADKLALTVKELEDADGQSGLRLAQYKARFAVQDERIVDMGQQLDSLYTAFTLLKEEFDSENDRHVAMLSNLNDADAEIARQTNKMEKEKTNSHSFPPTPVARSTSNASATATAYGSNASVQSIPQFISTSPGVVDSRPSIATMAPVSPATPATTREYYNSNHNTNTNESSYGYETPTTYATVRAFQPSPKRTPSTWELLFPPDQDHQPSSTRSMQSGMGEQQQQQQLISGSLIVESKSMLRKWKTKSSKIYLRGEGYQWKIGDKRSFPLQFGISKVEFHPNYPLSFAVYLDPTSATAPVIRAAAMNEHDYHRWMAALTKATSGEDYQGGPATPEIASHYVPSPSSSRRMQQSNSSSARRVTNSGRFSHLISSNSASNRSIQSAPSVEEQEDTDLKRILELSKHET